jgi:hypothetical protein
MEIVKQGMSGISLSNAYNINFDESVKRAKVAK